MVTKFFKLWITIVCLQQYILDSVLVDGNAKSQPPSESPIDGVDFFLEEILHDIGKNIPVNNRVKFRYP